MSATVSSYGVRLRMEAGDARLLQALLARLPASWTPTQATGIARTYSLVATRPRAGRRLHVVYQDGEELFGDADLGTALDWFEAAARLYVAEISPRRTFVHAGAVGWHGHAIVLPGQPNAGKSTLTAALVRAGASYLSDEFALLDDRARIHPFPKPLWFSGAGVPRLLTVPVEELGGVQETRALPLGLVVFTSFGAREWRPRRLTPGRAILEILAHTVSAQRSPGKTLERLERIVTFVPVLKGGRGEAEVTAPLILRRLEAATDRQ